MTKTGKARRTLQSAWTDYLGIMGKVPLARVLVWFSAALIAIVLGLAFLPDGVAEFDLKDALQDAFQILGFLIAALMVLVSIVHQEMLEQKTARQEIYQRLEFESIALFRSDMQNADLAAYIWADRPPPACVDENWDIRLQQYVTQVLNLFEMAVRFRRDETMPQDVFGSWVIWINDLCASANFCHYWRDEEPSLRWNYIPELRDLIEWGLALYHGKGDPPVAPRDETERFFAEVGDRFECDTVRGWFASKSPAGK